MNTTECREASTQTEAAAPSPDRTAANSESHRAETRISNDRLQAPFSWFGSVTETEPSDTCTLREFVGIARSPRFKQAIESIRREPDKKARNRLKKALLPVVAFSVEMTTRATDVPEDARGYRHSGILQIDVDTGDMDHARAVLMADLHCLMVAASPSGSIKAAVAIPASVETHLAAFHAAREHYAARGVTIDEVKDVPRLCYLTHDPEAWLREEPPEVFKPASKDQSDTCLDSTAETVAKQKPATAGLAIHGRTYTLSDLRDMLAVMPARTDYHGWLYFCSGAWNTFGDAATAVLAAYWPEEEPGEYAAQFKARTTDHTVEYCAARARERGWIDRQAPVVAREPEPAPPDKVFPIPAGGVSYTRAAAVIFPAIAAKRNLFIRGGRVVEIAEADGAHHLETVTARRFASLVENYGHRVARREVDSTGAEKWRTRPMPTGAADVLLESDEARRALPPITQVVRCEILTPAGDVLTRGYHDHAGGTFITRGHGVPRVPIEQATAALRGMLADFNFTSEADVGRAIAHVLSPAMKMGGHITGDFPLDLSEADQSQSGKTYRQKITAAIYDESPVSVSQPKGGVGSLDEAVASALLKGRPFVNLDNFRGRLDSTTLEQALRGVGRVHCRGFRKEGVVDCRPFIWQLSTNGAELTRDLANRSIVTRIRKQPEGYRFRQYPAGDLESHIRASGGFYRGCVFAVILAWIDAGRPQTDEHRHDFREWVRPLDWIIRNVFDLPPLLDGHREQQDRTANPALQWLRDVCHAAHQANMTLRVLLTSELVSIADDAGISFPGNPDSREAPQQRAGKLLGRLFRESKGEPISTDGFTVHRETITNYGPNGPEEQKHYMIEI